MTFKAINKRNCWIMRPWVKCFDGVPESKYRQNESANSNHQWYFNFGMKLMHHTNLAGYSLWTLRYQLRLCNRWQSTERYGHKEVVYKKIAIFNGTST